MQTLQTSVTEIVRMLQSPDTLATPLFVFFAKEFEERFLDPEAEIAELYAEINDTYGTYLSEEGENKLNAAHTAVTTDLFFTNEEAWLSITQAIYEGELGGIAGLLVDELSRAEILWAIYEVALLRGDNPSFTNRLGELIDGLIRDADADDIPEDGTVATPDIIVILEARRLLLHEQLKKVAGEDVDHPPSVEEIMAAFEQQELP